ncbi:hypothetical protein, partial [Steroidobacter sp.]|uniref:hypothetical protein n=1 Tax=Steroidobacter sp. TaxID=1978227 RepID=UPI001A4A7027
RFAGLASGVIAFDASVLVAMDQTKLALNEEPQERQEMITGLHATGDHVVAEWVARAAREAGLDP